MNNLNYASLEASKKLHDAGIILKTDYVWAGIYGTTVSLENQKWVLIPKSTHNVQIPAACFAEVWRELPADIFIERKRYRLNMWKVDNELRCCYVSQDASFATTPICNENPTDALIDLLIWVKEQNRERIVKKLIDHADKLKW